MSVKPVRSRITRRILFANISGLCVLVIGALVLNEVRAGYVNAKAQDLALQATIFTNLIEEQATVGEPMPELRRPLASAVVMRLNLPAPLRLIISDGNGDRVADSFLLSDRVDISKLPPVNPTNEWEKLRRDTVSWLLATQAKIMPRNYRHGVNSRSFMDELVDAFGGETQSSQRISERGQRVISATVPIRRVSTIVGYLTLESSDIEGVIASERYALLPFMVLAILVALLTGISLSLNIGRPLNQLSRAAEAIKRGDSDRLDLPNLVDRKDEIGALSLSIDTMTNALMERITANAAFAADVAHELKNPLTAIRSAVETADRVKTDPEKLVTLLTLIKHDTYRLDRLITDISHASRLEAELSKAPHHTVELVTFLESIVGHYAPHAENDDARDDDGVRVVFDNLTGKKAVNVQGRQGGLDQVFSNLIDNAQSFSAKGSTVHVKLQEVGMGPDRRASISVEDTGPGIPTDKLDQIFDRFYTDRPDDNTGNNSGLGLSIVRQIIDIHRGTIVAQNRPDGGAKFIVELRLH